MGVPRSTLTRPSSAAVRPLLTMPLDCGDHVRLPLSRRLMEHPGQLIAEITSAPAMGVAGCDDPRIRFEPEVSLQPGNRAAGGPTGLRVDLKVPQRDQIGRRCQEALRPERQPARGGYPADEESGGDDAGGDDDLDLGGAGPRQLLAGADRLGTDSPVTCPDSSQYGTLTLHTPILPTDAPMTGKIYVAKQNDNPFNNFLSLYLVVQDPERGLLVKIPGKVDLDPVTGQITTTFDELPQFPVSDMVLNLKGGDRAALVNPSTCGTKTITRPSTPGRSRMSRSWAPALTRSPEGRRLALRQQPRRAGLQAQVERRHRSATPPAPTRPSSSGSRASDDDQEFSQLNVDLPKGPAGQHLRHLQVL